MTILHCLEGENGASGARTKLGWAENTVRIRNFENFSDFFFFYMAAYGVEEAGTCMSAPAAGRLTRFLTEKPPYSFFILL